MMSSNNLISNVNENKEEDNLQEFDEVMEIENNNTIDTNDVEQMQAFVESIRGFEENEQIESIFEKISNLPITSKATGFGCTRTRVLKYLTVTKLLPQSLIG
jgi:hypothetical protein